MTATFTARPRRTPEQGLASMPPKGHNGPGLAAPGDDHDPEGAQDPSPNPPRRQLFSVPAPIKRIFDRFPVITYQPNDLPGSSARGDPDRNRLYVFIDPAGAKRGAPSFNPQCLRWQVWRSRRSSACRGDCSANGLCPFQAYLKFVGIDFDLIPSNNHASPTGALPYLVPAVPPRTLAPIPSNKLQKWAIEQVHCEEEQQISIRFDVYASLLDHRIRNAWVGRGNSTKCVH